MLRFNFRFVIFANRFSNLSLMYSSYDVTLLFDEMVYGEKATIPYYFHIFRT